MYDLTLIREVVKAYRRVCQILARSARIEDERILRENLAEARFEPKTVASHLYEEEESKVPAASR